MSAHATVSQDVFKEVMGNVPAAVTVVTALDGAGEPAGLTVSAFSVVSLDPPLVLVCVDKGSQTLPAVTGAGRFTVNFLAAGGEDLAIRFASKSAHKFDGVVTMPSSALRAHGAALPGYGPVLAGAACGYALCDVAREVEAGDHWIFVGEVRDADRWAGRAPLMYCRRSFSFWDVPDAPRPAARPTPAAGRALGLMLAIER